MLSSQSCKRAARINFELEAAELGDEYGSTRSKSVPEAAVERALILAAEQNLTRFDAARARLRATETVNRLVMNVGNEAAAARTAANIDRAAHEAAAPAAADMDAHMLAYETAVTEKSAAIKPTKARSKFADEPAKDTLVYVSAEEIEVLAQKLVASDDEIEPDAVFHAQTGSLSLAGFGRMNAKEPGLSVDAGIAVSPSITTHAIVVSIDYFTAVDDRRKHGAGHLSQAFYTTGVYYRSMTYDRRQLQRNWTGWSGPNADALLRSFVRNATLSLPQGKKNSTSADTMPDLIIAEAQGSRTGYQFQTPIVADVDGGYLRPSTAALYAQACAARSFDSRNFGATVVSGLSAVGRPAQVPDAAVVDMDGLTDFIVDWLRA